MESQNPADWYESKPVLEKVKVRSNWGLTLFSVLLFALSFLYLFADELDFLFYLVLVLFIHESGHYLFMKRFNYEGLRMLFIPLMGAFVQGSKKQYSQKESFLVIAAGPFPGVFFGLILLFLANQYQQTWLLELSFLFLFLNVINLLPIDPLDGGQLFKLFVRQKRDLFLLLFALLSSLLMISVGYLIDSWILLAFGFLMSFKVRSFQRNYQLRQILDQQGIDYELNYEDLTDQDYHSIKAVILQENPKLKNINDLHGAAAQEVIASHVNAVLSVPITRDTSLVFRIVLVCGWLLLISLPVFLMIGPFLDFTWYFETL
jgi:membrane-associated protease RseP (regulator of RpoE activity)